MNKFLFNERKPKNRYHAWNGADTACRMWSTGGIKQNRKGWVWSAAPPEGRELCLMCEVCLKKP